MRYCRFHLNGSNHYGFVEAVAGNDAITRMLLKPPHASDGDVEGLPSRRMDPIPLAQASLVQPVEPTKIVCVGRNYREHAAELGHEVPVEPLLFFKPPSALLAPGATILRPKVSARFIIEANCATTWRRVRHLRDDEDVRPYILGYTCVDDFIDMAYPLNTSAQPRSRSRPARIPRPRRAILRPQPHPALFAHRPRSSLRHRIRTAHRRPLPSPPLEPEQKRVSPDSNGEGGSAYAGQLLPGSLQPVGEQSCKAGALVADVWQCNALPKHAPSQRPNGK